MKTITLIAVAVVTTFLFIGCKENYTSTDYLKTVLTNLDKIKSATYNYTASASAPGDTLSFSTPRRLFIKEFVNPTDEFVGASSISYDQQDTTRINDFYDGFVKGEFNWEEETITIDSFQNNPYPIRLVLHPFYTRTKNIIKYALETNDSIKTDVKDYGDSVRFSLWVYDKVIEFVTRPFVEKNPYEPSVGKISQYDIWIRKSDNLPYRMRRKMNHQTSFVACTNVKLNTTRDVKFVSADYIPEKFSIKQLKRATRKRKSDLEGKVAPDWMLFDLEHNAVGLKDLKSKVLLIQFTGVGCGPCHSSIPFLKKLANEYNINDFELIVIEFWSNNMAGLKRYRENNDLNFRFLNADEDVIRSYQVTSAPVFFILDENRVIRKVIMGYGEGTTDTKIRTLIDDLID